MKRFELCDFADHVRRHWFVAARSETIQSKPTRVFLLGWPVVLVRHGNGSVIALEDRCPHRGLPLSDGRAGPEGLSCRHHGWTFDHDGRCTAMPGMMGSVGDVRVPSFAVTERDGFIWVARATAQPLPERVTAMQPENRRLVWQAKRAAPVIEAQKDFLDARTRAIHPGLVRGSSRREAGVALSVEGDGFRVDYGGEPRQPGFLRRFLLPQRIRERAYFSGLSVAQLEYRYSPGWAIWITVRFTPETLVSTQLFATLHVEGRCVPTWLVKAVVSPLLRSLAGQDRVESPARDGAELSDRPLVAPRDVVRPHLEEAWSVRTG